MERMNRAREQGWRSVLGSGGSGDVKVGSRCRNVVYSAPSSSLVIWHGPLFSESSALGGQLLGLPIINLWMI